MDVSSRSSPGEDRAVDKDSANEREGDWKMVDSMSVGIGRVLECVWLVDVCKGVRIGRIGSSDDVSIGRRMALSVAAREGVGCAVVACVFHSCQLSSPLLNPAICAWNSSQSIIQSPGLRLSALSNMPSKPRVLLTVRARSLFAHRSFIPLPIE